MAAPHFQNGTHHCAIFHGDDHGAAHRNFKECTLHPGHQNFMTVDEFLNETPSEFGLDEQEKTAARNHIDRTVRVVATHISTARPDTYSNSNKPYPCVEKRGSHIWTRYGTGYLSERYNFDVMEPCPCPECITSTRHTANRKSYHFVVKTATHVIFDKEEAQNAVFEFFYDSEDLGEVKKVYGVSILGFLLLETDMCFVNCVTHDGRLAEKLGLLCDRYEPFPMQKYLVSHPHGVSKRISVGEFPQITFLVIANKNSFKLKKSTTIRFPGCHDAGCAVVRDINRLLDKRVIDYDDVSKTFVLNCDLSIYRPEGVVAETGDLDFLEHGETNNKAWWNVFSYGTQLVTDDGKRCNFPYKDVKVPKVKMEAFEKLNSFLDIEIGKLCLFIYYRYTTDSCPGSSGAHVVSYGDDMINSSLGHVHFGDCGDSNASSLIRVYISDDYQESNTNSTDLWMKHEYETRNNIPHYWITRKWSWKRRENSSAVFTPNTEKRSLITRLEFGPIMIHLCYVISVMIVICWWPNMY